MLKSKAYVAELIVLFACLNATGCSESISSYYSYKPQVKAIVDATEDDMRDYAGPFVSQYAAPVFALGLGRDAVIRLTGSVYLNVGANKNGLIYRKEF